MLRSRLESLGLRTLPVALCAFGAALFAPTLFGATCTTGTLLSYESGGANFDCTIGPDAGYTMDFDSFTSTGLDLLTASDIMVTPSTTATSITFEFSAEAGYEFAGLSNPSAAANTYVFEYTLDPPLPKIESITDNTGPGDPPTLNGFFCGDGTISGSSCVSGSPVSIGMTASGVSETSATASFPTPETSVETQLTLTLDPCEYIENFGSTVNLVPEPSMLWLTPGLVGVVWLRKKWLAKGR
jgi:hypothetical protein